MDEEDATNHNNANNFTLGNRKGGKGQGYTREQSFGKGQHENDKGNNEGVKANNLDKHGFKEDARNGLGQRAGDKDKKQRRGRNDRSSSKEINLSGD